MTIAAVCSVGLLGCGNQQPSNEPIIYTQETIHGEDFEEDIVATVLNKYSESGTEEALQLFLKYFKITNYADGIVTFTTIDTSGTLAQLNSEEINSLNTGEATMQENLVKVLDQKVDLPVIEKTAEVVQTGNVFTSNKFIAEELDCFLQSLLKDSKTTLETFLNNSKNVDKSTLNLLEAGKSIIIPVSSNNTTCNVCITIKELLEGEQAEAKLREKNNSNSYLLEESNRLIYLRYSIVNLNNSEVETPDSFKNIDEMFNVCELESQPSGIGFPKVCNPLVETECEKVFLLESESSNIYLVDNNKIFYLVRIGGNNEE